MTSRYIWSLHHFVQNSKILNISKSSLSSSYALLKTTTRGHQEGGEKKSRLTEALRAKQKWGVVWGSLRLGRQGDLLGAALAVLLHNQLQRKQAAPLLGCLRCRLVGAMQLHFHVLHSGVVNHSEALFTGRCTEQYKITRHLFKLTYNRPAHHITAQNKCDINLSNRRLIGHIQTSLFPRSGKQISSTPYNINEMHIVKPKN